MKPHKIGILIFTLIAQFQIPSAEITPGMLMMLDSEGNPCEKKENGEEKWESMGLSEEDFDGIY